MNNAIAYLSLNNFGGIVILALDDDYVTSGFDYGNGIQNVYRGKVKYDLNGVPYFSRYGTRYNIDDFMRV